MIRKMALTQTESGILHVDDHHRHQYHHDEVYDVEHHSWAVSYDILRHKIERYKLRAEVGCRERVAHETREGKGKRWRTGTKAWGEGGGGWGGACLNAASSSSAARGDGDRRTFSFSKYESWNAVRWTTESRLLSMQRPRIRPCLLQNPLPSGTISLVLQELAYLNIALR